MKISQCLGDYGQNVCLIIIMTIYLLSKCVDKKKKKGQKILQTICDQWFNLAWSLSCTSGERVVGWLVWDKGDHLSYRHHHKVGGGTSSSLHSHHRHHHTHMFVRHSWEQAMHLVVVLYSKMSLRRTNSRCKLDVSNAPTICNDRFIELSFADSVPLLLQAVRLLKSISLVVSY